MDCKNRILKRLLKKAIERNKQFEDIHKGESCYIFGNGVSIKYFDLEKFNDRLGIGCGALFLHRDFKKINVKYYYEGHTFLYYPYWINTYSRKFEKNSFGLFYRDNIILNDDVLFFISLSNYFAVNGHNVYYAHHFDKPFEGFSNCRLDGNFTALKSGLHGMLGLAIFMGFKDITLVGCDYTFFPQPIGHFYEFKRFDDQFIAEPINKELLTWATKDADIRVVIPSDDYHGHMLPYVSYKDLTGAEPIYKENYEIVSASNLSALNSADVQYNIYSPSKA